MKEISEMFKKNELLNCLTVKKDLKQSALKLL